MSQTYTFHVSGMHCRACVLMTDSSLEELPEVAEARSSLKARSVTVTGEFGDRSPEQVAADLSRALPEGYRLSVGKQAHAANWREFGIAVPAALAFAALFVLLQKAGIVNLVDTASLSYGTVFLVGVIASLSTCMAVVGGLVLSMSATFAKEGDRTRPQLLFHAGRLVSFFVLGGAIGAIGSAFALSSFATFALGLLIGIVMLILGINLLDVFPWAKRLQPSMPRALARRAHGAASLNHTLTPALVGIATFFLPCGFTQSMQLYTLSAGGFLPGALTMLAFALGTLPVLALVSFSSLSVQGSPKAGVFFKAAGLVVILFALFNIANSLAAIGLIPPLLGF